MSVPHRIEYEEIPWLEPALAYARLRGRYSVLLESVSGPPQTARYSLVCSRPAAVLRGKNGAFYLESRESSTYLGSDPIEAARWVIDMYPRVLESPGFSGGLVGVIAYDIGRHFERLPATAEDDLRIEDLFLMVVDSYVLFDHATSKVYCCALPGASESASRLAARLRRSFKAKVGGLHAEAAVGNFASNVSPERFMEMVEQAKEYINAGDIYQVNLSQRLTAPISGDPFGIYLSLRLLNPSPFSAYLDGGDMVLAGCSPERLVSLRDRIIQTRPIAGTYRRGRNDREDKELRRGLLADGKERAEHIMLVDLERNDLGRVSVYGSVRVDQLMVTETYSHVNHIVSNVVGELRPELDQFDVLRACFPGGTITGCPKVRAMEIIEELEPVRRGVYTGSMGYFGFDGNMDLNIVIRSMLVKDGLAHVQAGAGIVADSVPLKEHVESLRKAQALLEAAVSAGAVLGGRSLS